MKIKSHIFLNIFDLNCPFHFGDLPILDDTNANVFHEIAFLPSMNCQISDFLEKIKKDFCKSLKWQNPKCISSIYSYNVGDHYPMSNDLTKKTKCLSYVVLAPLNNETICLNIWKQESSLLRSTIQLLDEFKESKINLKNPENEFLHAGLLVDVVLGDENNHGKLYTIHRGDVIIFDAKMFFCIINPKGLQHPFLVSTVYDSCDIIETLHDNSIFPCHQVIYEKFGMFIDFSTLNLATPIPYENNINMVRSEHRLISKSLKKYVALNEHETSLELVLIKDIEKGSILRKIAGFLYNIIVMYKYLIV